ncbi:hypothetical protein HanIR_Chr14g0672391 [Helianthus annuus]|nr:hypothetical protein HanIR_Chr14g0672391 [Helianthus annuus]
MDQVVTMYPSQILLGLSLPTCTSHMSMALQTISDLFFLICYIPGFYTNKGLFAHLHMNSLNIIVDFSTYMYFRELKDLARYGTFSRCTSYKVIQV